MKKYLIIVITLVSVMLSQAWSETNKTLKVGINATYPPFEFIDKKGEIVGFDIDLMNALSKNAGYSLQFVDMDFDALIPALITDKIDIISSGMSITPERLKKVDFSDPYYEVESMVVVRADDKVIEGRQSFKNKLKVGVELGSAGADWANANLKDVEILSYNNVDIYTALLTNKVDAIIMDNIAVEEYLKTNGKKVKMVGEPLNKVGTGLAIDKKNKTYLSDFNKALSELKKNGEYKKIYDKWFGSFR